MTPARKLTHNTKLEHFLDAERHEFQERHNYSSPWAREMPKSNPERPIFGNAIILRYLGPEKWQNQTQKDTNFEKLHSLTPAKMTTNKESIHFFQNFAS